jgi:hypothetical protein
MIYWVVQGKFVNMEIASNEPKIHC